MNKKIKYHLIWGCINILLIVPIWIVLAIATGLVAPDLDETEQEYFATSELGIAILLSIILGYLITKRIAKKFKFDPNIPEVN